MVEPAVFTSSSRNPNGAIATVSCHFLGSPLGKNSFANRRPVKQTLASFSGLLQWTGLTVGQKAMPRPHCHDHLISGRLPLNSDCVENTEARCSHRNRHRGRFFVRWLIRSTHIWNHRSTYSFVQHTWPEYPLNIPESFVFKLPTVVYIQHPQTWFSMVQCVPTAGRCPTILFCILTRNLACFCRALGCCVRRFITLAISAFICPCPRLRRRYAWKSSWQLPPRNALHGMHNKSLFSCNPHQAGNLQEGPYREAWGTCKEPWGFAGYLW